MEEIRLLPNSLEEINMPVNQEFDVDQLIELTPGITKKYANTNRTTVSRDLQGIAGTQSFSKNR